MAALPTGQLFGVFMAGIGLTVVVFSGRYVWRASAVYRSSPIESLKDTRHGQLVKVSGTVTQTGSEVLTAPFSGQKCVALRYEVEERRLSPFLIPKFVTIHETAGSVSFAIDSLESTIDVIAPSRTVTLQHEIVEIVQPGTTPPERIDSFERGLSTLSSTTFWRNPPRLLKPVFSALTLGTRRYAEQCASPGDQITIVGRVSESGEGINPLVVSDRSPSQTISRMAKTSLGGLLIGGFAILIGFFILLT